MLADVTSRTMRFQKTMAALFVLSCFLLTVGCRRESTMDPYPQSTDLFRADPPFPPVILVGRVLDCVRVGSPRLSKWDGTTPFLEFRTSVAVENVLKGTVASSKVEIGFFVNARSSGPPRLGTLDNGGTWRIGDREIFFLQLDSGHLRTVCDTWAHCVVPVLSGFHASLQPRQDVGEAVADILITRGQGTSDAQMIKGLQRAVDIGFAFARDFSMKKLEELVETETPPVRQAACHYLRMESHPYDDPYYAKTLSEDPDFRKALAACPYEKEDQR